MKTTLALLLTLLLLPPPAARTADAPRLSPDEQLLRGAHIATDDAALVEFFRKRTPDAAGLERIHSLVRRLGDNSFQVREQASSDLVALGRMAVPLLEEAVKGDDLEVVRRARECLQHIVVSDETPQCLAAARLLALRRPAGTAEALLAYVPFAENPVLVEQIGDTLAAGAVRDGKPDPVLVKELAHTEPLRRSSAAEALCRAGAAGEVPGVAVLLHDPDLNVRMRVAVARAVAGKKDAIAVLIDLLTELPARDTWPAENLLLQLGQRQAPTFRLEGEDSRRRQCHEAWAVWWTTHEAQVELANLELPSRVQGFTLVVLLDDNKVVELDGKGQARWHIDGLAAPLDAQMLPGDRVLIAEFDRRRVTERNLKGEILWEKETVHAPIGAQRLRNGHTFIITHEECLEVEPSGKEIVQHAGLGHAIISGCKGHDGRVGLILQGGTYQQFDAAGKKVKEFPVSPRIGTTCALSIVPNGNILVADYGNNKIVELGSDGKSVWSASIESPISATRLADGSTLAASQTNLLVLLDPAGQKTWEQHIFGHPTRVSRR